MRKYVPIIGFILISCSGGKTPIAENGLNSTKINVNEGLTELIYGKTRSFPDNTQFSIAIIDSGKVKFIGVKRVNDTIQQVHNQTHIFEIGSITKVFTSTLLSYFVVNNKLELNHSIQDFIDFEIKTDGKITFRQLANHTSGLPKLPSNLNLLLADPANPYKNYDDKDLEKYLTEEMKLRQSPGAEYAYSNLGAGLMGYILMEFSKSTYDDLLHKIIFSRYGMTNSTTNRKHITNGLVKGLDKKGRETSNWDMNALVGAGGILSCVEDLSKFAIAQFDKDNTELALTQQPTFTISERMKIGLGWHIVKSGNGGNEILWHNGGTGGYTSSMALDIENQKGIIILSNVSAFHKEMGNIDALCFELLKTM